MANGMQFVFQLREKISRLMEWAKDNDFPLNSTRAIERAIGLNHSTLFWNMEKYRMSLDNQIALANAYGFDVEWPEWRDPKETRQDARTERRDTAEAFIARFIAERMIGPSLIIEAKPTGKHIERRFADVSFAVPASYVPTKSTNAIPMTVKLAFGRRGLEVLLEDGQGILILGLKQADLQLFYDNPNACIEIFPLKHEDGMDGNFCGDVEGLSPWWVIRLAAGELSWLAGKWVSNDGRDCICHGFQAGDIINAILTARISDFIVRMEGEVFEGLSRAKGLLIQQLAKLSVLKDAEAVLCERALTVVSKS